MGSRSVFTATQRSRIDSLLDRLLDLPQDSQLDQLRRSGERDAQVVAEVESLLRAARAAGDFLCVPAASSHTPDDAVSAAATLVEGTRLGAWRIERLIGRGGMGDVYEAERVLGDYDQRVAIKVLHAGGDAQLRRFHAERQILARLEHPGIARLHDGGVTDDGRPFMVMEFVKGASITDFCQRTRASLAERLSLFMQVCDAVAFAHRNLIVHRDLKASNILVTADREVKLLDFGIAKLLDPGDTSDRRRAESTQAMATFLTPSCAAPEQLTGGTVTTATDVYALGVLLFELLAGRHPWLDNQGLVLGALRGALDRAAPPASAAAARNPLAPLPVAALRGDLDAIVAKALRTEPAQRYATVEGMKRDVQRSLRGAPVEAREGARLYLLGRLLQRYRWAVAAIAAVIVSLAGGLGLAAWQAQRAAVERDAARRDAAREEAVRYSLTSMFRAALTDRGDQPATAKNMIDDSAARVLREYRDKPQLAGQIVLTLADLYGALEDITGAGSLLDGYVAQADPRVDPESLADARQKLANIELSRGHMDRAGELLDQADAYWKTAPHANADVRLEGLGVHAKLQRARGDLNGAIATSRDAIAQRTALSGHDHRETAVLYNTLAITLTAAYRLDEALAAYRETTAIYRALGLGDGLDAQIVLANTGTLEVRIGDLADAERLLRQAIDKERALAGDSAAVAAAMGYYGSVLNATHRSDAARDVLRDAVAMADRYAGPTSPVALLNRLFLGEAQAATGDTAAANATFTAIHEAALRQYGRAFPLTLRSQVALARIKIAAGAYSAAETELTDAIAVLRTQGLPGENNLAEALDTLGDLQRHEERYPQAIASLREAVALREKTHYQTPELAGSRARLADAMAAETASARTSLTLSRPSRETATPAP